MSTVKQNTNTKLNSNGLYRGVANRNPVQVPAARGRSTNKVQAKQLPTNKRVLSKVRPQAAQQAPPAAASAPAPAPEEVKEPEVPKTAV